MTAEQPNKQTNILLVEDDLNMRNMLTIYLTKKGYKVTAAVDGLDGLNKIKEKKYPVVLSDIAMPGATGIEILKAAKEKSKFTEVILITAYASVDNVIEAMKAGAYQYVLKPIENLDKDIGLVLQRACERRELTVQNNKLLNKLAVLNNELQEKNKHLMVERKLAGHIQNSLLPPTDFNYPRLDIAVKRLVSSEVSGDFHDFIPLEDGSLGVLIGQAFGRDLPAALLMSMIMGRMRELAATYENPVDVLTQANLSMRGCLDRGYGNFVSAFYGIIDFKKHTFRYASADHVPPIYVHFRGKKSISSLKSQGPFLGKYPKATYNLSEITIKHGDRIALFTERVLSIQNAEGDMFGKARLKKMLEFHGEGNTYRLGDLVQETLRKFSANGLNGEDLTFLLIDYP